MRNFPDRSSLLGIIKVLAESRSSGPAEAWGAKTLPRIAENPARLPDHVFSGPDFALGRFGKMGFSATIESRGKTRPDVKGVAILQTIMKSAQRERRSIKFFCPGACEKLVEVGTPSHTFGQFAALTRR